MHLIIGSEESPPELGWAGRQWHEITNMAGLAQGERSFVPGQHLNVPTPDLAHLADVITEAARTVTAAIADQGRSSHSEAELRRKLTELVTELDSGSYVRDVSARLKEALG